MYVVLCKTLAWYFQKIYGIHLQLPEFGLSVCSLEVLPARLEALLRVPSVAPLRADPAPPADAADDLPDVHDLRHSAVQTTAKHQIPDEGQPPHRGCRQRIACL